MVNILSERHAGRVEDGYKYIVDCPSCGTNLNFGPVDVYKSKDCGLITQEYIDCPECNEMIQLDENCYFSRL